VTVAAEKLLTRGQAIRLLEGQRAEIHELLDRLAPADRERSGLGGGSWSPKDLIGHLESWEEFVLDAIAAWERGERAPIDTLNYTLSTSRINAHEVERKAARTWAQARTSARATRERLIARIEGMSEQRWASPATPRARKPLGHRVGQLLVGTRDPFTHDRAHLKDLRAFVEKHGL
jgi:DinB superfamily